MSGPCLRILVAEDSASSWFVIQRMLEMLGHKPERARTGLEAVDMALGQEYDLALLDCYMPGLDGDETARRIREARPALKLIGMTASDPEGNDTSPYDRLVAAGVDQVLAKPLQLEELKQILGG